MFNEDSRKAAGIQMGTGYFFVFEKVACPLSGNWILVRDTHG
jgi:hypothetical protein